MKPRERSREADNPPPLRNPPCSDCKTLATLVTGAEIYRHRPDLHGLRFWKCPRCPDSYVGCHKGGDGQQALGFPAGRELRRARGLLHELLDPLWFKAPEHVDYMDRGGKASPFGIRRAARRRVYAYVQVMLKITADECHIAKFDLERCRAAYRVLMNMDYGNIRAWWKNGGEDEQAALG